MPAILSSSLVFSALVSGRNTAPMTGDRQTFLTTARGLDEAGSNRYTAVVRDTCLKWSDNEWDRYWWGISNEEMAKRKWRIVAYGPLNHWMLDLEWRWLQYWNEDLLPTHQVTQVHSRPLHNESMWLSCDYHTTVTDLSKSVGPTREGDGTRWLSDSGRSFDVQTPHPWRTITQPQKL